MTTLSYIAQSGMQAAQVQLNTSANNVANAQTEGFQRRQVQQSPQPGGGVATQVTASGQAGPALEADLVNQLQAKNAFLANLAVFKSGNAMAGALLDTQA